MLRLLLHDFGGYAFTRQLAGWLAKQGHDVLYVVAGDLGGPNAGAPPSGANTVANPGLRSQVIFLGRPFERYRLSRRMVDEITYGGRLARLVADWRPDIVLSANTPPFVQYRLRRATVRVEARFVNWVQDIFGLAGGAMPGRWGWAMRLGLLSVLRRVELSSMRGADGLVLISPDFQDRLEPLGVQGGPVLVQENWAPLSDQARPMRDNGWSRAHGLSERTVFLLAGTLGLKHNPGLVVALAQRMRDRPDVRVVVVSEGPGRQMLEQARGNGGLDNLLLLDFQPVGQVQAMLASASIGIVILNRGAGAASVPSKLYSYAAAGVPVLAAIPSDNLAHRLIQQHGLGLVVEPEDEIGFQQAADRLLTDADLRAGCAASGLAFAHWHCDIDRIGGRFNQFLTGLQVR